MTARPARGQWALKFKLCVTKKKKKKKKNWYNITTLTKKFQCCRTLKKKIPMLYNIGKKSNISGG